MRRKKEKRARARVWIRSFEGGRVLIGSGYALE